MVPSAILSQYSWFNRKSKYATKKCLLFFFFWTKYHFFGQLFKTGGAVKPRKQIQEEYGLVNKLKFKWIQIIYSSPKPWIDQIFMNSGNWINLAIQDHHLIKKHQTLCLDILDSKELYNIQLLIIFLKSTSQGYFGNVFAGHVFEWNKTYVLPRIVTTDSIIRMFYTMFYT